MNVKTTKSFITWWAVIYALPIILCKDEAKAFFAAMLGVTILVHGVIKIAEILDKLEN